MDAEPRAAHVVIDDVAQHRQQLDQRPPIVGHAQVAIERVEEPQRRVGGVIEALVRAFGEHVRDEAVADVVREHAQDRAGLGVRPGAQRQALERDHRVAAPVREPVVAGDHRPRFVAGGARAHVIFACGRRAGSRTDRRRARARRRRRCARPGRRHRAAGGGARARRASISCALIVSSVSHDSVDANSADRATGLEVGAKPARRVQLAARRVAAALLDRVARHRAPTIGSSTNDVRRPARCSCSAGSGAGAASSMRDAERRQRICLGDLRRDRLVVAAELERRAAARAAPGRLRASGTSSIDRVRGRTRRPRASRASRRARVAPDRQPELEPELDELERRSPAA